MRPVLQFVADGEEHSHAEAVRHLADEFGLSDEERHQLLPSGRQALFYNRVHWARTYLRHAGLIENTRIGRFRITGEGTRALRGSPARIDNAFLRRYPEFARFHSGAGGVGVAAIEQESEVASDAVLARQTPEESLEASYQGLRAALAEELLDRIAACPPAFFERLVVDLLVAMGYGGSLEDAGRAVGRTGDGGIDGIIKEDKLGLDAVYIQAKRWTGNVGVQPVKEFAGSLIYHKARKGVMIATSEFTKDAHEFVTKIDQRIVLIGGKELAQLLIDHGVGVKPVATYRVFRADADYFSEAQA